jgi:hypothetical protein
MLQIIPNYNTAYKTLAKHLSTEFLKYPNLYNHPELISRGDDFVELARENLKQESEKMIRNFVKSGTPKMTLPKVYLVVSPQIESVEQKKSILELLPTSTVVKNSATNEELTFTGDKMTYRAKAQVVIFSRSEYTIREMSLRLVQILRKIKMMNYCLKIFDSENPNDINVISDFGKFWIRDLSDFAYTQEDDEGSKILASGLDFYIEDEFFLMEKVDLDLSKVVAKEETELKVKKDSSFCKS